MGIITSHIKSKKMTIPDNKISNNPNLTIGFEDDDSDSITFDEIATKCCVGIVDIIASTKTTAYLSHSKICRYYGTFLSTMNSIVKKFGGTVVKNGGDSLLYYFHEEKNNERLVLLKALECNMAMIDAHKNINKKLYQENIPSLNYRISIDYGEVLLSKSSNLLYHDIFGSSVNMCSKINHIAKPNTIVIGGDMYRVVKNLLGYTFNEVEDCSIGFKLKYTVYSATRNHYHYKTIVENAIKHALLDLGVPILDKINSQLFINHDCLISNCYENPEILGQVLMDTFGNNSVILVQKIITNLGHYIIQKPIQEFISVLEDYTYDKSVIKTV